MYTHTLIHICIHIYFVCDISWLEVKGTVQLQFACVYLLCLYIYVHIYSFIYIYAYMYIYIYHFTHTHTHIHTHEYSRTYVLCVTCCYRNPRALRNCSLLECGCIIYIYLFYTYICVNICTYMNMYIFVCI